MTHIAACVGCASKTLECPTRDRLRAAVRGLGVTSIRHRCRERVPLYSPGDPVLVKTAAWMSRDQDPEDYTRPPQLWFPGHFIRQKGASAIAFIKPQTPALDSKPDTDVFETSGEGYVKVPLSRLRPYAGGVPVPIDECRLCGNIIAFVRTCNPEYRGCPREAAPVRGAGR